MSVLVSVLELVKKKHTLSLSSNVAVFHSRKNTIMRQTGRESTEAKDRGNKRHRKSGGGKSVFGG